MFWFDFCFTALHHILGHFERDQSLPFIQCILEDGWGISTHDTYERKLGIIEPVHKKTLRQLSMFLGSLWRLYLRFSSSQPQEVFFYQIEKAAHNDTKPPKFTSAFLRGTQIFVL